MYFIFQLMSFLETGQIQGIQAGWRRDLPLVAGVES